MPLGLDAGCRARLREAITEGLPHLKVDYDTFINAGSTFPLIAVDEILPARTLRARLEQYIDETPLLTFLVGTLNRELGEARPFKLDTVEQPLTDFPEYKDAAGFAARLIRDFESLPWKFSVSFELPGSLGEKLRQLIGTNFPLSPSLRIVAPDEKYGAIYPLRSGIALRDEALFGGPRLFGMEARNWSLETVYLQAEVDGFVGPFQTTASIDEALGKLKSFIGLLAATRLMKVKSKTSTLPFGGAAPKSYLIVHRDAGGKWEMWSTVQIPPDLAATLNALAPDDWDGRIKPEHHDAWMKRRLDDIGVAFHHADKAEKVLLAAQWLLDSYVGANELLSFVQTTVAMEIMLGDKSISDVIGVGELLRNRCAYLIGKSHSEREWILSDFNKIYRVRSGIVHSGKSKLGNDERTLFRKLQWMCRRAISEELELIKKDVA